MVILVVSVLRHHDHIGTIAHLASVPAVEHEQAVLLRGAQLEGEAARGGGLPARQHLHTGL